MLANTTQTELKNLHLEIITKDIINFEKEEDK